MSTNGGNTLSALYEQVKRFASTRQGTFLMIYWPVLLGMPLVLLAPENILYSHPWLLSATNFFGQHFPMIVRLSEPTDFPQVAKLFYSVMFLLVPLLFFGLLLLPDERIVPFEYHIKHKIRSPLIYAFFAYGFVLIQIAPSGTISPLGGIMKLTRHSRFGLGVLGSLFIIGMVSLAYMVFLWIKRIPKIYKFRN